MAIDWDVLYELSPADTTYVKDTDDSIRSLKTATRERITKEHEFDLASQARQGLHRAGSAVTFYQASAPTQRVGVALAAADAGLLWVDSDDKLTKVWDGDSFEGLRAQSAVAADLATNATNADTVDNVHVGTALSDVIKVKHGVVWAAARTYAELYGFLSPALPNVGDYVLISGAYTDPADNIIYHCAYAKRESASTIGLRSLEQVTSTMEFTIESIYLTADGTMQSVHNIAIAW